MITCDGRSLAITWPECDAEFRQIAARYFGRWLPRVLEGDRAAALERLLVTRFSWFSPEENALARRTVLGSDSSWIIRTFHEIVADLAIYDTRLEISLRPCFRPKRGWKSMPTGGCEILPLRPIVPSQALPPTVAARGGVIAPAYQSETVSLSLFALSECAVKIGAGRFNAFTGLPWTPGLSRSPQNYIAVSDDTSVEGYVTPKRKIHPFDPPPISRASGAREQVPKRQIRSLLVEAYPIRPSAFIAEVIERRLPKTIDDVIVPFVLRLTGHLACLNVSSDDRDYQPKSSDDTWDPDNWDLSQPQRVWIHLCNALTWVKLTGELPPHTPISRAEYADWNFPWRETYGMDLDVIDADPALARLKVNQTDGNRFDESAPPQLIIQWSGAV